MDNVKSLKAVDSASWSEEQRAMVELMREMYEAARKGFLREVYGVAVFLEEGQIDLVRLEGGDPVVHQSEVIVELEDIADELREERRQAIEEEKEE